MGFLRNLTADPGTPQGMQMQGLFGGLGALGAALAQAGQMRPAGTPGPGLGDAFLAFGQGQQRGLLGAQQQAQMAKQQRRAGLLAEARDTSKPDEAISPEARAIRSALSGLGPDISALADDDQLPGLAIQRATSRQRPMTPEELKAAGFRPGTVAFTNDFTGGASVGQQPDYKSPEAEAQALRIAAAGRAPAPRSELERKRDMMVANGVPVHIAQGIVTGQFRLVTNDVDGSVRAIDMANGREMWNPDNPRQPTQPPPSPPAGAATPPPAGGGTTGTTIPTDNVDYPGATGLPGAASRVANTIADMFGGTLPAPERERAAQALTNLASRTQMHLQTAIPGRPSNYLMEMIGDLTLKPGEITVGPQRAAERVRQTRQFVEQTVKEMEDVAGAAGQRRFSREQIAQANLALQSLRPLLADYRTLDEAFAGRGAPGAAATTEPTATNHRTGQQMIYRGGQWIPKP
jgi:hypothetical protein